MKRKSEIKVEISRSKRFAAALVMFSYIGMLNPIPMFALGRTKEQKVPVEKTVKEEKAEVLISASKGGRVSLGEASIEIPEGALKEDTKISITRLLKVEDTGESLYNAIPHSGGYRFLPAGTKFEKDVTITLPYSAELNAKPQSLEDLYTYFYDTQTQSWIKLERIEVDQEHSKVRSLSTHFTDMITATLTMPESASPVDVNLNSIKNLEAAKPDVHLIKFNPPKASNMGDASFSFELAIPAGRRGMQPSVSVSYSSGAGNGIMGKGFDVNYGSSITTDTRFGLPKYDTNDTYMLDGIILKEDGRKENKIIYRPMKEASFSRIERILSDNHWEVTDKNGTKRIYGQDKAACVGSGSKIFTWNLSKTIDINGNTVTYGYNEFSDKQGKNTDGYVYPTSIRYTGYKEETGKYSVVFHYDNDGKESRQDVRIDARSKSIVACRKLLTGITTHYDDGEAIRTYGFKYTQGLAKENMLEVLEVSNNAGESYSYSFEYNEPVKENGQVVYFAEAEEWNGGKPLQVGNSTSTGMSFNFSGGAGYGTRVVDGRATGGASGSKSSGTSYTEDSMVDINGDGRPDAVSQDGNTVYVAINNGKGFDSEVPVQITNARFTGDLDHEENTTSTTGWNVYGGVGIKGDTVGVSIGSGYSEVYQKTSSTVMCSFMDMDRNEGNLKFSKAYIATLVDVKDVSQESSLDDRNNYYSTYYVQNPFRKWKSPYEGVITVHEKMNGITSGSKNPVNAMTFIGNASKDSDLFLEKGTDKHDACKTNYPIDSDVDFYFVSDPGNEPKNSDAEWNVNIEYSKAKALKKNYPLPLFVQKNVKETKEYHYDSQEHKAIEDFRKYCTEDFKSTLPDSLLMDMYDVNVVNQSSDSGYKYYVRISYSDGWKSKGNAEAIYDCLVKTGYFIPGAFTAEEFTAYEKEIKESAPADETQAIDYYRTFASQFVRRVSDGMFLLKDFKEESKALEFYSRYPLSNELKQKTLGKYRVEGTVLHLGENVIAYGNSAAHVVSETRRDKDIPGTGFYESGKAKYNIGYAEKDGNKVPVFYNATDGKIECTIDDKKDNEISEVKVINPYLYNGSESFKLDLESNLDEKKNEESKIRFELDGISYRAVNMNSQEFKLIMDDFTVAYTNVYDSFWKWSKEKEVKEADLDAMFEKTGISGNAKVQLTMNLYGERKAKYKKAEVEESEESQEVLDYYYYSMKDSPDYVTAQKILDEYKKNVLMNKDFPFYEEKSAGNFLIKDYWKTLKTKDEVYSYHKEEAEKKVKDENTDLDLTDTEDFNKFTELVEAELERIYREYRRLNELLVGKCRKFNLSKIGKIGSSIGYNNEHLYVLTNDTEDLSGTYQMLQLDGDASDGITFRTKKFTIEKTVWNSKSDFDIGDRSGRHSVYSYDTVEKEGENTYVGKADIFINNDEFLYGGNNGWFYGIWKSVWQEDINGVFTEKHPFSVKDLRSLVTEAEGMSEEEFNKAKANKKAQNVDDPKRSESETDVHFSLPETKENSYQVKELKDLKNNAVSYHVDFEKSLLGIVAVTTKLVKDDKGKKTPVTEYYMPFIYGDVIHADRAGGNAYYEIEGIGKPGNGKNVVQNEYSNLVIPTIRKTYTEGTDKTPNLSMGFGGTAEGAVEGAKILDEAKDKLPRIIEGGASGSLSAGENTSDSYVKQAYQDINGDGIPDIMQVIGENSGITAVLSSGIDGDKVTYDRMALLGGINVLGNSHSEVNVYGGSVSPGGNISITPVGFKRMSQRPEQKSSPTPSGGITYSSGDNYQSESFIDINGDGLCDYFANGTYKINKGASFDFVPGLFTILGNTSSSAGESKTVGMNFSLGTGGNLAQANSLSCGANANIGLSYSFSSNNTDKLMMDINGDGLQDVLEMSPGGKAITVKYNTGNSFVAGDAIALPDWSNYVKGNIEKFLNNTDSKGYDLGFVSDIPVVGATVSKSLAVVSVNPFGCFAEKYTNSLDWSSSTTIGFSGSAGANVNIGIDIIPIIYVGTINITVSGGAGANASTTINGTSVRMMDLDGDGLADHVLRVPGVGTYWKRNISGLYGKLNRIDMPQGGHMEIGYAEKTGTVDNPNFKYVMSSVTVNDGCGKSVKNIDHGSHSLVTLYEYGNGWYDRQQKEFYGYDSVTTKTFTGYAKEDVDKKDPLYTTQRDAYYMGTVNEATGLFEGSYYSKGMLRESMVYGSAVKDIVGSKLSRSVTEICASPYAMPRVEESWTYEEPAGEDNCIHTSTTYAYDFDGEKYGYGNCTGLIQDFGDEKKLVCEIDYKIPDEEDYITGLPEDIRVYSDLRKNNLLRHRSGKYDGNGQLVELSQYYSESGYSTNTFKYDGYGNIESVTDSRGATLSYAYDMDVHSFVTEVKQKGNDTDEYAGAILYDPATQTKTSETDCNGNTMEYRYDGWQRITEIRTGYDGDVPAVRYEYSNSCGKDEYGHRALWHAVTSNKVTFDPEDHSVIQTVVQIDGLGRAVRTAKTGCVNGEDGWNVSGAVTYDEKGRTIQEGMTDFILGSMEDLLSSAPEMSELTTKYEYDDRDRQIKTILPDDSTQTNSYSISVGLLVSRSTDPLGNMSVQKTDSRGNIVFAEREDQDGKQLAKARYEYNEMGEMILATSVPVENMDGKLKEHPVTVEYDILGRRTAIESSDSGRQEFFYDACSNLVRENNSVLRENHKQITYEYDGLNRLVRICYPDTRDTEYTYGRASDKAFGAAGKILCVKDASGKISYKYGRLGEVTKETRTLETHLNGLGKTMDSEMEYCSDYLGRMQWIKYPDEEVITYGYDNGGQVKSVTGMHWGTEFKYVTGILYDQYGQRTRIEYGNGIHTDYSYDPARRWLETIKTSKDDANGNSLRPYQNIEYTFDPVGNVLGYENDCMDGVRGNYCTSQNYSYDGLYQLVGAHGESSYTPDHLLVVESTYTQDFAFDAHGFGNMMSKTSSEKTTPWQKLGDDLNYELDFEYDEENHSHRRVRAGDRCYKYDSCGNIICEQDGGFDGEEDDSYHRINRESDDVYSTDYGWALFRDDSGDVNKLKSHYKRVYGWDERNRLVSSVDANYTTSYIYSEGGERTNKYTASGETLYFNRMWTLHTDAGNRIHGGQYAKNVYLGETRIVTKLRMANDVWADAEEVQQYFYHSDHLGSASMITDYKGDEYQRIEYTPYGETWIERTDNRGLEYLPYKFSAKEKDEETGLYYYGARYLDPKYSTWISTDPALGEYIPAAGKGNSKDAGSLPGMGGAYNHINFNLYHYAGNNPVKYVDPDGRDIVQLLDSDRGRAALPLLNKIPFGHAAALVGNDSDGWLYYSNDGPSSTDVQWFSSKQDFFDNYAKDRTTPFNYQEGSSVKTSVEQDKAMQTKAFELAGINTDIGFEAKETGKRFVISEKEKPSPYRFLTNNCSQHVGEIALSGDVFTTGDLIPKLQILMDKDTFLLYEASKCMNMSY